MRKLISVSVVLSNDVWVVSSQLFSGEGVIFAMEIKMPLASVVCKRNVVLSWMRNDMVHAHQEYH